MSESAVLIGLDNVDKDFFRVFRPSPFWSMARTSGTSGNITPAFDRSAEVIPWSADWSARSASGSNRSLSSLLKSSGQICYG